MLISHLIYNFTHYLMYFCITILRTTFNVPLFNESIIVCIYSFSFHICAFDSLFLRENPKRVLLAQRKIICFRHLKVLPNCLSGKLDEFRLPLAVYQNIHFFQHMLSLNFVSYFNICQWNELKFKPHFICISLKLNIFSFFANYFLLPWLFFHWGVW